MHSSPNDNRESFDAERVDTALKAISSGDLKKAESILLDVIENTPPDYSNTKEVDDVISIKFWDQTAFFQYIAWHKSQDTADKKIYWIRNAYPRAYYYLGFLCVKLGKFDQAIDFLNKGECLEPTNPNFPLEMAFVLAHFERYQEALALYDQIIEIGPFVSAHDIAVGRRGRGFVLIEMGDLEKAEASYKQSLKFEPGNKVAQNQLLYIEQLRKLKSDSLRGGSHR